MKRFKLPEDLRKGDVVGPFDKPWYEVLEVFRHGGGRFIRVKVRHIPDGGLDVREFDREDSDRYGELPVETHSLRKVSG